MKINLMLPTRGRPDLCYRFCKSVNDTAADLDNILVSVITDLDDDTYPELKDKLSQFSFIKYLPQVEAKVFPGLVWYWDKIIEQTFEDSDVYGMVADDMICRDDKWDALIREFFNNIPDKIGMIHFNSNSPHGANLCINSFVHKRYIEISGSYNDARLKGDYSDNFLFYIFNSLGRIGYVENNIIEHMHYDFGRMEKDPTAVRRRAVDHELYEGMSLNKFYKKRSLALANSYIKKLQLYISIYTYKKAITEISNVTYFRKTTPIGIRQKLLALLKVR